ncbi:hypothetical protein Pint_08324 [Pistacia integerrima]|uniref:Uncharacterized protein n=1 Tax=Pistacia integerrima TaxID=434235 RepID=A0ACC0XW12_9ROSI|nr:hypothetical protein Pint_08324 [Pistacia integerrima]
MIKRVPNVLFASIVNTVKPKIKVFQDLGFSSTNIADVMSSDPWILNRSVDKLVPSILVLKSVSGSNASVAKLLKTSGWFLKCFWLHKPDSFKEFVKRVDEIGFDRKSKMFLPVILTIGSMSMETLELKLKCFRSLGFKEDGIVSAFRRSPQTFVISKRKIREVTEVMLSRGNLDISVIVNNPRLLICNVERSLKPGPRVFDILEKKYGLPHSDEVGELSPLARTHN